MTCFGLNSAELQPKLFAVLALIEQLGNALTLRAKSCEMNYTLLPGKSYPAGTEAETLSAVRSILTEVEEMAPPPRKSLFGSSRQEPRVSKANRFAPLTNAEQAEEAAAKKSRVRAAMPQISALKTKAVAKIKRKHLVYAALAALVYFRPMWVLLFVVLSLFLAAAIFFLIGGEKIWRGVMLALHRVSDRDPERAVRIRKRLDAFALRWDALLDRFPEGSADKLYMPDFQVLSAEEARNEARFVQRMEQVTQQAESA